MHTSTGSVYDAEVSGTDPEVAPAEPSPRATPASVVQLIVTARAVLDAEGWETGPPRSITGCCATAIIHRRCAGAPGLVGAGRVEPQPVSGRSSFRRLSFPPPTTAGRSTPSDTCWPMAARSWCSN